MLQPAVIFKICILPYEMLMHFIPFVFLMWTFKIYSIKKQFFTYIISLFLLFSKKKLQDKCLYLFWKAKSWKRQSCLLVTQSQANVDFLRFKHPIHMMMIRIFAFLSSVMPNKFPYFVIQINRHLTKKKTGLATLLCSKTIYQCFNQMSAERNLHQQSWSFFLPLPASKVLIRRNASASVALRHVISSFWSCTRFSRSDTRSLSVSFSFSTMSSENGRKKNVNK